jgi:hypothetical protein
LASQEDINDKAFHKDGEPAMGFGPRDSNLDNPMLLTGYERCPSMDQRLKLVRVQMASGLFRRMGLITVFPGAFGALEFALQIMPQV